MNRKLRRPAIPKKEKCPMCRGSAVHHPMKGTVFEIDIDPEDRRRVPCRSCGGTGIVRRNP